MHRLLPCVLTIALSAAFGQDERRVSSPDGQLEFRLLIAQPGDGALFRLSYQILFHGKRLVDTSFLGLNIRNQEPLLGENVGLTSSHTASGPGYHTLIAEYMQNGSIGRRLNLEVRAANDGIALRYVVPRSTPLEEILIEDEVTEFDIPGVEAPARVELPFAARQPDAGWIGILEIGADQYPRASLERSEGSIFITRLARHAGDLVAFEGSTPLTCPWRVVVVGLGRESLGQAEIVRDVGR